MLPASLRIILAVSVIWLCRISEAACLLTIPVTDAGKYDAHGDHYWWVEGYETGDYSSCCEMPPYRSFFVFNIPQLTQAVVSAKLKMDAWTVITDDSFETLVLRRVNYDVGAVRAGGMGQTNIYAALASGTIWGARDFTTEDSGQWVEVPLNNDFVATLNATNGGWVTLGGSVPTLDATPFNRETLFAYGLHASSGDYAFNHVFLELELEPSGAPTIIFEPQSTNILAGSSLTLHAEICGELPLQAQWQHDGTDIPGANTGPFLIQGADSTNAGNYRLIARNALGSATSEVASVTVEFRAPYLVVSPGDATVLVNRSVNFFAQAAGAPAPALQWLFNGAPIPDKTNGQIIIWPARFSDAGQYQVVASNSVGVVTSEVATLTVETMAPVFTMQPSSSSLVAGQTAFLYALVDAAPTASLQWFFNGNALRGQRSNFYSLTAVPTNHGEYYLVASNIAGVTTSSIVTLAVTQAPPQIGVWWEYQTNALVGSWLYLNPTIIGGGLTYHWYFNNTLLAEQTNAMLLMSALSTNQAGVYYLVASNILGVSTSQVWQITVSYSAPRSLYVYSSELGVPRGGRASFYVYAEAAPPAQFYLQRHGTNVNHPLNGLGQLPALFDISEADAGTYRVLASNSLGTALSDEATLIVTTPEPLDDWTLRNPFPLSEPFSALTYGNGRFVLGGANRSFTSTDGTQWNAEPRFSDGGYLPVTFGNGRFVSSANEAILVSSNGSSWVRRGTMPASSWASYAQFAGNKFFVSGNTYIQTNGVGNVFPILFNSEDGDTWTTCAPMPFILNSIAFGGGLFVASGFSYHPAAESKLVRSTNGSDWELDAIRVSGEPNLHPHFNDISFFAGRFIAASRDGIFTSTDSTNWSHALSGGFSGRLVATPAEIVAMGTNGMSARSTDGVIWTVNSTSGAGDFDLVAFGAGRFVATDTRGRMFWGTNGANWIESSSGLRTDFRGTASDGSIAVIVGSRGQIVSTTNGTEFVPRPSGVSEDLLHVHQANGLFVAVGTNGTIVVSTNGIHWSPRASSTSNTLLQVAYGAGHWVAVGDQGTIVSSPDGSSWTACDSTVTNKILAVAFGNGRFVALTETLFYGTYSTFLVSLNGIDWSASESWLYAPPTDLAFGDGLFVATSPFGGSLLLSVDGVDWQQPWPHFFSGGRLNYVHGAWFGTAWGQISTSVDLFDWKTHWLPSNLNMATPIWLGDTLLLAGDFGTILQSGPLRPRLQITSAESEILLSMRSDRKSGYTIQTADDVNGPWFNAFTGTNSLRVEEWSMPPSEARKFFRVMQH